MRFGFMSSVAPGWTLDRLVAAAGEYGFEAVELRVEWGHAAAVELDATAAERRARTSYRQEPGVASVLAPHAPGAPRRFQAAPAGFRGRRRAARGDSRPPGRLAASHGCH